MDWFHVTAVVSTWRGCRVNSSEPAPCLSQDLFQMREQPWKTLVLSPLNWDLLPQTDPCSIQDRRSRESRAGSVRQCRIKE